MFRKMAGLLVLVVVAWLLLAGYTVAGLTAAVAQAFPEPDTDQG